MNKKTKNFSDLSKKQKDKIISDSCEGANEEQAKLLLELTEKEKEKDDIPVVEDDQEINLDEIPF